MIYLNKFRRKPAISKFDWPFTPNHKSSPFFSTNVSSAFPQAFRLFSACSWLDHLVSGLFFVTYFFQRLSLFDLSLLQKNKLLTHYTKGTLFNYLNNCLKQSILSSFSRFSEEFQFFTFPSRYCYSINCITLFRLK